MKDFPKVGDILKYKKVPTIYYPMFTNMKKYAKENLIIGNEYEVSRVEIYSSWCAVWLKNHGDNYLNLCFFEKNN